MVKTIVQSARDYELWLRRQLGAELVASDLKLKHEKMRENAFVFLRATYWRWAERILERDVCPELKSAPSVVAVGDIHLENFGTWRDNDGRLVWGVNDFDEAAEMPYAIDLVRLAVSAILARGLGGLPAKDICAAILEGYKADLKKPRAFVLDEHHQWLLKSLAVRPKARTKFWRGIDKLKRAKTLPPARYRDAIEGGLPGPGIDLVYHPRTAGTGSLGRPRWVGVGLWRGGRIVREAKALVPSGWTRVHAPRVTALRCADIVSGAYRAADPYYEVTGNVVVRRLSPSNHKIEVDGRAEALLNRPMLRAMGGELAALHLGTARAEPIAKDLAARPGGWLLKSANRAARFVERDYKAWCNS